MKDEVFEKGDLVRVLSSYGYSHIFKEGEIVTVEKYIPEYRDSTSSSGFTRPACISGRTKKGKWFKCHANRVTKEGVDQ